jgi:hypothetical protein
MFKKQGTSKRSASTSIGDIKPGFHEATPTDMGQQASACDMTLALEELEHCEELSEVQLATVVGGKYLIDDFRRSEEDVNGGGDFSTGDGFYTWLVRSILGW